MSTRRINSDTLFYFYFYFERRKLNAVSFSLEQPKLHRLFLKIAVPIRESLSKPEGAFRNSQSDFPLTAPQTRRCTQCRPLEFSRRGPYRRLSGTAGTSIWRLSCTPRPPLLCPQTVYSSPILACMLSSSLTPFPTLERICVPESRLFSRNSFFVYAF